MEELRDDANIPREVFVTAFSKMVILPIKEEQ